MTRRILILLAVALLAAGTATAGEDDTSVFTWSSGGGTFVVNGAGALAGDDVERTELDLADLADGETRTIPTDRGDILATREGDVVTVSGPGLGDERVIRLGPLSCDVADADATCTLSIMRLGDDRHAVALDRSAGCEGDDCPHVVSIAHAMHCAGEDCDVTAARNVTLCAADGDDEDGSDCRAITIDTLGGAHVLDVGSLVDADGARVLVERMAHGAGPRVVVTGGDSVALRCPEGDTTMTVDRAHADEVYLCPEHSLPLEKTKAAVRSFTVTVDGDDDDGSTEY